MSTNSSKTSHRKIIMIGSFAAVMMFGFCFAIVPFYGLICKVTGINTSIPSSDLISPALADTVKGGPDLTRTITVQFVAENNLSLPWEFYPHMKSVQVHPGQSTKVYFYAKNTTGHSMTVQAIPSMTPTESLGHLHKIECFCFRQQTLKGHESKEMPLIFQVDKQLPKEVNTITLAYTLFDATPKEKGSS